MLRFALGQGFSRSRGRPQAKLDAEGQYAQMADMSPWVVIIGRRNRLVHGYMAIDAEAIALDHGNRAFAGALCASSRAILAPAPTLDLEPTCHHRLRRRGHCDGLAATAALVAGTSNPVRARETPGGVGRNVAAVLARLGARVSLASQLGDDATGDALAADLRAMGVNTAFVQRQAGAASARYWAVLEPTGELALGLSDMAVIEALAPADDPAIRHRADAWLIDANLPQPCIVYLLDHARRPPLVAVNTVSVSKARKLEDRLGKVNLLVTNEAEAVVLCGAADARRLVAFGCRCRRHGAGALPNSSSPTLLPAAQLDPLPLILRDVTGAGDALAAATLFARLHGLELPAAARIGRLAASCGDVAGVSQFGVADFARGGLTVR